MAGKTTKTIGHYRVLEKLGEGGMGVVYKAEDTKLKRTVALKFLPSELTRDKEAKQRFLHEARAASALDHPNICTIFEVNETDEDQMFIAMAYYEGETLQDKIKQAPLAVDEAVDIACQIARDLQKAHDKEIVHRDIKPANVLITEDGQVKILDFGLAKLKGQTKLTKDGTTLGTVNYMSPEQATGEEMDHRSDIWSLGVVLYEMFTGQLPFKGEYPQAVIYSILNNEPKAIKEINPDIPKELEGVVLRALAKKPADRYPTSKGLLEDLEAVSQGLKPLKAAPVQNIRMAILPFANLTGDIEQEYLSDGFTQEMISQLGRLHPENLSVIARSSVMRYKNANTPIDQIGLELGVDYVLEGSTRREAEKLRVSADLIQVRDQIQIWGDTYEREFSSILKLQSEVAQNVGDALALKLLPAAKSSLNSIKKVNPETYEAYLKGLFHAFKFTPPELETARQYFESALEIDPDYALAHTGIALVWVGFQQMGTVAPSVATPKAKKAVLKALELDDMLAEGHFIWAGIKTWSDWDWEAGEKAYKRALEINPNYPEAMVYYSHLLYYMNRIQETFVFTERALKLDPLSSVILGLSASVSEMIGRYDDAIKLYKEVLKTSPHDPIGNNGLWMCFHGNGMYEEAMEAARMFFTGVGMAELAEAMVQKYKTDGYHGAMNLAGDTLMEISREIYFSPFFISSCYAFAGEKDKALECLEKAYEIGDPMMPYMIGAIFVDIFGDEPRFQDLLDKMKFPAANKKQGQKKTRKSN